MRYVFGALVICFFILPQEYLVKVVVIVTLVTFGLKNWSFNKVFLYSLFGLFFISIVSLNFDSLIKTVLLLSIGLFSCYELKYRKHLTIVFFLIFGFNILMNNGSQIALNFHDPNITGSQVFLFIYHYNILPFLLLSTFAYYGIKSRMFLMNVVLYLITRMRLSKMQIYLLITLIVFFVLYLGYNLVLNPLDISDNSLYSIFDLNDESNIGRFSVIIDEFNVLFNSDPSDLFFGVSYDYPSYMDYNYNMQMHNGFLVLLRQNGVVFSILYIILITYALIKSVKPKYIMFVLAFIYVSSIIFHTMIDPLFIMYTIFFFQHGRSRLCLVNT